MLNANVKDLLAGHLQQQSGIIEGNGSSSFIKILPYNHSLYSTKIQLLN